MKTVLVTGGGRGIGAEIVRQYQDLGCQVYIFNLGLDDIDVDLRGLNTDNIISVDFRVPETIEAAFGQLLKKTTHLDVLVNNAGIFPRQSINEISLRNWFDVININLTSYFFCAQNAAKMMKDEEKTYITNISSDAYNTGAKKGAHYSASKAGIIGLSKSLANTLAIRNINVNVVIPGVTDTRQSKLTKERRLQKAAEIPLGRVADVNDVAKVVVALSSGDFDYMTGQKIVIDGGKNSI
jgi:NAD(P)-dependent dehydrogenase (short-subunit alcohol dehydrogenase family)